MSATIKGFGLNEIKAQPGFRPKRSANGAWSGEHTFTIKRSEWSNPSMRTRFAKGTSITTLDTSLDSYWSFMKVVDHDILHDEGDLIVVGVTLAGGQFAQYGDESLGADAVPTYRLSGYLQEAPLDEHKKWRALTDEQKNALGHVLNGNLVFDEESGKVCKINADAADSSDFFDPFLPYDAIIVDDALEFAKIIAQGKTTYLRPVLTWTENTQGTARLTAGQINKLGKIATPRGNPPEPNGGRNWMLTSAFQDETGDVLSTALEWTLSERDGHNEFLYDD